MRIDSAQYRAAFRRESAGNPLFINAQRKIRRLMHLFLLLIGADWLACVLASGFGWAAVLELAAAVLIHIVVETLVLRGFAVCGGLVVLLDEGCGLYGVLAVLLDEGCGLYGVLAGQAGAPGWHTIFSALCSAVLLGIGLYLIFGRDIRAYAKRARALLRDTFKGSAAHRTV